MKKRYLVLWIMTFCSFGCLDQKNEPLDFFEVHVLVPEIIDLNTARLKGQIIRQGNTGTGECGFIWSYNRTEVEEIHPAVQRITAPFPAAGSDGAFSADLDNLEREKTVFFRAFVQASNSKAGERDVVSEKIEAITVGEIVALTGIAQIFNDSAVVYGQLRGVKGVGEVDTYGHVISETNPAPVLGCADCMPDSSGPSNDDNVFSSQFPKLKFNTTYFVRAYAKAEGDIFYSKHVDSFRVADGWIRIADFPYPYAEGAAAVWNGRAYAGFGCKKSNGCMPGDLVTDFWAFDPAGPSGAGEWSASTDISPFITNRFNATAFALDNDYYAIFGEYYEFNSSNPVRDFCKLDLQNNTWTADIPFSASFTRRTGAVSFVINDKAYVGTGRDKDYKELNDFWEYDPVTSAWRKVANMPLRKSVLDNAETLGRYEAVAFTAGNYAYVGAGQIGGTALRDFWRFSPDSIGPGEWTPVAFLPPEAIARYQAVAFSINDKGYVGTGYNPTEGYLNDFWEYDPTLDQWSKRTAFRGLARTNAMGFALGGYGYIGTGQTKVPINGGQAFTELSLPDFWRYIPATK